MASFCKYFVRWLAYLNLFWSHQALCLFPGVFRDKLCTQKTNRLLWKGPSTNARCRQTATLWITRLTGVGAGWLYPAAWRADCKSCGNVPSLCGYRHLSPCRHNQEFIHVRNCGGSFNDNHSELVWWQEKGQTFLHEGINIFLHNCESHFLQPTLWLVYHFLWRTRCRLQLQRQSRKLRLQENDWSASR